MKTLYSTVCLSLPGKHKASFDLPLITVSPELAKVTTDLLNQLGKLYDIKPMRRNIIPLEDDIHHLIISKDRSSVGFASTIHVTTKADLDKNSFSCRIVRAASRLKITAAPTCKPLA